MTKKRLKCKTCNNHLFLWGKTQNGKKRYFCKFCKTTRIYHREDFSDIKTRAYFRQYILWGLTYKILSDISGLSIQYLAKSFQVFLNDNPPNLPILPPKDKKNSFLLIDGLWFGRWFVLMVYRQSKNLTILRISTAKREVSTKIEKDIDFLLKNKFVFSGVVSDGGTGIKRAVHKKLRGIPHQICLAHMHRAMISGLGKRSKDYRIQELKALADHVWKIESKEALKWWRKQVSIWIEVNSKYLKDWRKDNEGHWWFVHRGVRKAVRIMKELPFISFKFLTYPLMPKTTNEIEAQFGHLGKRWLIHRGLKQERWEQFLKWFVYFYNEEKLTDRKTGRD